MAKLTDKRIKWLVKQVVNKGKVPSDVALSFGVSVRRVQQLAKKYLEIEE